MTNRAKGALSCGYTPLSMCCAAAIGYLMTLT